jgi:lipopolysaccharide export system permease protein
MANGLLIMTIIHKYIVREIFKFSGLILTLVIGIYLLVDFFERLNSFMEAALPMSRLMFFLLLKLPSVIAQIIPVSILLAILSVFGLMTKNNEVVALKSSGISVYHLLRPILSTGLLLSSVLFLIYELVVPYTEPKANRIQIQEVEGGSIVQTKKNNIWVKAQRQIINIKHYDPINQKIFGVSLFYFDPDFKLQRRVDAQKASFLNNRWHLFDVMEQTRTPENEHQITFFEEHIESIGIKPKDLTVAIKESETMNFRDLYDHIRTIESEGYDAKRYWVDLHAKIAFPFACIILCMVGTGVSLRNVKKSALALNIAIGIGIAFSYWVFHSFCVSLGYADILPAPLAAWATNIIFLCFGLILLFNAE